MDAYAESIATTINARRFRIWREEVPWFTERIRANYPALRAWADRVEQTVFAGEMVEWAVMEGHDDLRHFEAAMADLEAGRCSRPDRGRILPKWDDGSYRPA